jgi:hypothetical protein
LNGFAFPSTVRAAWGRRKKGDIVNGWIDLDKPFDMTSTDAVSRVRRLLNAQKAGHAGTLDPLAPDEAAAPGLIMDNIFRPRRAALPV